MDDTPRGLDEETARRTREIRTEIEQTREDMSETIEAIQERLRPGNIVSEATARVKNATTERVRHMMGTAGESAQGAMEQTRQYATDLAERTRHNAIPAAMIGIGVAWLLIDRLRGNGRQHDERYRYRSRVAGADYDEADEYYRSGAWRDEPGVGVRISEASWRVRGAASDVSRRALRTGRRARNQFQRLLHENPLMVGAAAMVVGAAVGMALPETERENEWMGETKETVVDRAQDVARDAASRVQEAAGDVAGEVASRVVSGKDREP